MPYKVLLTAVMLFFISAPVISASPDEGEEPVVDYAAQFVTALSGWDKEKDWPAQPALEGVKVAEIVAPVKNRDTGAEMRLRVAYPQNTGHEKVDQDLKAYAEEALARHTEAAQAFTARQQAHPGLRSTTCLISRSIERFMSVIFFQYVDEVGAHPYWQFETISYDLKTGRRLTVKDVFRDTDDGLLTPGFFVNYVNAALDRQCLDEGYDCRPSDLTVAKVSQNTHRNLVLTPQGVAAIFNPYDLGPWVEGVKRLNIPKQEMADWGVRDAFWIER